MSGLEVHKGNVCENWYNAQQVGNFLTYKGADTFSVGVIVASALRSLFAGPSSTFNYLPLVNNVWRAASFAAIFPFFARGVNQFSFSLLLKKCGPEVAKIEQLTKNQLQRALQAVESAEKQNLHQLAEKRRQIP